MIPTRIQLSDANCPVSDSDYEAIVSAIMETSRGRWFLTEYAKRNRHADTQMLVTVIDKMKETLDLYGRAARPYMVNAAVTAAGIASPRPNGSTPNGGDQFDFKALKNCA